MWLSSCGYLLWKRLWQLYQNITIKIYHVRHPRIEFYVVTMVIFKEPNTEESIFIGINDSVSVRHLCSSPEIYFTRQILRYFVLKCKRCGRNSHLDFIIPFGVQRQSWFRNQVYVNSRQEGVFLWCTLTTSVMYIQMKMSWRIRFVTKNKNRLMQNSQLYCLSLENSTI